MNEIKGTWERTYARDYLPQAWGSKISVFSAINDRIEVKSDVSIRVHSETATAEASIRLTAVQMREFAQMLTKMADRVDALEVEAAFLREALDQEAA